MFINTARVPLIGFALSGELNHLPYLLSISVSMAVINDFSTNYMKVLGLNKAYMLLKLRNNNYIVLICSFGSIGTCNLLISMKFNKVKKIPKASCIFICIIER